MKLQYVEIQAVAFNTEFAKEKLGWILQKHKWPGLIFSCKKGGFTSGIYPQPISTLAPTSAYFMFTSLEGQSSLKSF